MATFLISLLVLGLAVLAMSIGVLNGREPIRGSCGGIAGRCALCSGAGTCRKKHAEAASLDGGTT